jgi:hypothetical protein
VAVAGLAGAVLVAGELAGTWRRSGPLVTITTWRPLSPTTRAAVELEARSLPLPDLRDSVRVRWAA